MLIPFFLLTIFSIIIAIAFLCDKKAISSLIFSIVAFISSICVLPAWYYALLTSGKNTAWLGFERYGLVVITLFVLIVVALLCIVKSMIVFRLRHGEKIK